MAMADRRTTDCVLRMSDNCNTDNTIVTRSFLESNVEILDNTNTYITRNVLESYVGIQDTTCPTRSFSESNVKILDNTTTCITRSNSESNVGVPDITNTCISSSISESNVGVPDNTNTRITRSISEINIGKPDNNIRMTHRTSACNNIVPDHTDITNERGSLWSFFERMSLDHNRSWYPTLEIYNRVFVKIWTFLSLLMNFIPFSLPKKTIDKKKIYTQNKMESFVYNLLNFGRYQKFKVPKNNIKGCGGFYEDMSSTKANDCDYGIELDIPSHYIELRHVCDVPCEDPNRIKRKRYFEASFTKDAKEDSEFVAKWACQRQRCHHDTNTIECVYTLHPKVIQSQFEESITHGLQMLKSKHDFAYGSIHKRGPAVSIAFTFEQNKTYCLDNQFTVDLTLQLRPEQGWQNCSNKCLINMDGHYEPTMVPSADYWRISFADHETDIIRNLDVHAKKVYFEAKRYRDKYQPSLATYPLKQGIIQKRAEIKTEGLWVMEGVKTLLDYIGGQVHADNFKNYFYPGDPIIDKQDKAFTLVMQLQKKVNREALYYKGIFIASWTLFALCFIPMGVGTVILGFQGIDIFHHGTSIKRTENNVDITNIYLFRPFSYILVSMLNILIIGSVHIYLQGFESVISVCNLTILSASCVLYLSTHYNMFLVWFTLSVLLILIFVFITSISCFVCYGCSKCNGKSVFVEIFSYYLFIPICLVFIGLLLRPILHNVIIKSITALCLFLLTIIASYIAMIAISIETILFLVVIALMLTKLCPCLMVMYNTFVRTACKVIESNVGVLVVGSFLFGILLGILILITHYLSMMMAFHALEIALK